MAKKNNFDLEKIVEEKINYILKDIPSYILEVGVFAGTEKDVREKERLKGKVKTKTNTEAGLTNAQIMFIMENGSPMRNIPARPVLKLTKEYAERELVPKTEEKIIDMFMEGKSIKEIDDEVGKLAMRVESYAKVGIRRNQLGLHPNALSTIKKKKSDIPLLDTGQLANSIKCVVRKKES